MFLETCVSCGERFLTEPEYRGSACEPCSIAVTVVLDCGCHARVDNGDLRRRGHLNVYCPVHDEEYRVERSA